MKKIQRETPRPRPIRRTGEKGFTLVELLVVVGIILIVAAIAVPNLLNATWAARQTSANGFLDAIVKANSMYESKYQNGYAPSLLVLAGDPTAGTPTCDASQMLDNKLITTVGNSKQYVITYTPGAALPTATAPCTNAGVSGFLVTAVPLTPGAANSYCVDEKAIKHVDTTGGAAPANETTCDGWTVQ